MKTVSPYLSAEALGLKEEHRQALIGLANDLVHHRIPDNDWLMTSWEHCICGHLRRRTGVEKYAFIGGSTIGQLFTSYSGKRGEYYEYGRACPNVSQEQAGRAAFNYLTIGEPRWDEVLSA